jgi:hypothetical protein
VKLKTVQYKEQAIFVFLDLSRLDLSFPLEDGILYQSARAGISQSRGMLFVPLYTRKKKSYG